MWWDARGRRLPWLIALVLVFGGAGAAIAKAEPVAHASGAVSLTRVFVKSNKDAKAACYGAETYFRLKWKCEGWWGGSCSRRSLTRPNYVWCARPRTPEGDPGHFQYFFMSSFDGKKHLDVWRSALYYAGVNGTSAIRLTRGTTKWKSRVTGANGGPE